MVEIVPRQGPDVPIPHDMEALPDDLTIIARLIDANCRAHSEVYGYHLDSRCLSHYNEGIVRLAQAGMLNLKPVVNPDGTPKVALTKSGEEVPVLYEDVIDSPAQAVRVRGEYVPYEKMVDRPTSDPMWKLQTEELARLRHELNQSRSHREIPESEMPSGPRTAPRIVLEEEPEWQRTAPRTPQPDQSKMAGARRPAYPGNPDNPPEIRTANDD